MSHKNFDKDTEEMVLEHAILEKVGALKGDHFLPKKKSKKKRDSIWWLYLIFSIAIPSTYLYIHADKIEKNFNVQEVEVEPESLESNLKVMHLYEFPNHSLYSFCKKTGIKESEIRNLNPWINRDATNISAEAEIVVPIH